MSEIIATKEDQRTPTTDEVDVGLLTVQERFAIVPEWLLDADVSDTAIRLYAVLLRYGQSSGARMPGRATLARRLRKKSVDTVDRALKELVAIGAVSVEHRYDGAQRLTNRYHLHTSQPPNGGAAPDGTGIHDDARTDDGGSRKNAATPEPCGQAARAEPPAGGRKNAATLAAEMRHNPKHFTQNTTTSTPQPPAPVEPANRWRAEEDRFLEALGISDADAYVAEIRRLRRDAGGASARWARPSLVAALQAAVKARGWPAEHAAAALRIVAADPATRSPMRLPEAGPWWDDAAAATARAAREGRTDDDGAELPLAQVEAVLADADGLRVHLQAQARHQLRAEGEPVTRSTVLRRAHQLLTQHHSHVVEAC